MQIIIHVELCDVHAVGDVFTSMQFARSQNIGCVRGNMVHFDEK
jgi:hypothetical protein